MAVGGRPRGDLPRGEADLVVEAAVECGAAVEPDGAGHRVDLQAGCQQRRGRAEAPVRDVGPHAPAEVPLEAPPDQRGAQTQGVTEAVDRQRLRQVGVDVASARGPPLQAGRASRSRERPRTPGRGGPPSRAPQSGRTRQAVVKRPPRRPADAPRPAGRAGGPQGPEPRGRRCGTTPGAPYPFPSPVRPPAI